MKRIERHAIVPYTPQQMFDLVNDIESYPSFMAGCVGAKILERGEDGLKASLSISRMGMRSEFSTRNRLLCPPKHEHYAIAMSLDSGPFKSLEGEWQFLALSGASKTMDADVAGTKVVFWLELGIANPFAAIAAKKLFDGVATEQVQSVCDRAKQLYG